MNLSPDRAIGVKEEENFSIDDIVVKNSWSESVRPKFRLVDKVCLRDIDWEGIHDKEQKCRVRDCRY